MRTKEECITWQNQSHLVQRYLEQRGLEVSLLDICRITDVMSEYAIKGREKIVLDKLDSIEKYLKELDKISVLTS